MNLVFSGTNESQNLGPFIFTLSGTVGATYTAVEPGVPAIAFSASTNPRSYTTLDFNNTDCTAAAYKWKQTRLTVGAVVDHLVVGPNGLPAYQNLVTSAVNKCVNGDSFLPGETTTVAAGACASAVSVFSTDYDAPLLATATLKPAFSKALFQLNHD